MFVGVIEAGSLAAVALCALLAAVVSFFLDAHIRRPPSELQLEEAKRREINADLAKIVSVQLEFVRHSLLSRSLIKTEKRIEQLNAAHSLDIEAKSRQLSISKGVAVLLVTTAFWNTDALLLDRSVLWPLSMLFTRSHLRRDVIFVPASVIFLAIYLSVTFGLRVSVSGRKSNQS